jgi:hypothetical protein
MENNNNENVPQRSVPETVETVHKKKITITVRKSLIYTVVVILLLIGAAIYCKKLFIAASVDGSYISRMSVVRELEKQGGKKVLDTFITRQLIGQEARKKISLFQMMKSLRK